MDGRNKLFFFANYQRNYDNAPAQSTPTSTIPANEKHLNRDFSDMLALRTAASIQICKCTNGCARTRRAPAAFFSAVPRTTSFRAIGS